MQSRRRRKSSRDQIQFFPEISPRRDLARRRRISSRKLIFTRFYSKIAPHNPRSINRSDRKVGRRGETAGKSLGCCNLEKRREEKRKNLGIQEEIEKSLSFSVYSSLFSLFSFVMYIFQPSMN